MLHSGAPSPASVHNKNIRHILVPLFVSLFAGETGTGGTLFFSGCSSCSLHSREHNCILGILRKWDWIRGNLSESFSPISSVFRFFSVLLLQRSPACLFAFARPGKVRERACKRGIVLTSISYSWPRELANGLRARVSPPFCMLLCVDGGSLASLVALFGLGLLCGTSMVGK